jgi:hypothetical protein
MPPEAAAALPLEFIDAPALYVSMSRNSGKQARQA